MGAVSYTHLLEVLIEQVLDRTATMETINIIERTAKVIADSAGCAIGYEAAHMVLKLSLIHI